MAVEIAARDPNRNVTIQGVDSISFDDATNIAVNATTHAMLVEASITPSGTQDVNLTKVGGTSFALGQQLAASSLPVVLTATQISTLTPLSTVAATQSGTWTLGANSGVDIGDVTVNNAAGASAVNIQDGGNTITVDGTVAVTNAGTFVVQENGAALTALQLIDNAISGAGFNITQFAGVNNVTGSGTATGALRVELPTNGTGVIATVSAVTAITNALPAGTNNIGQVSVAPQTANGLSVMNATSSDGSTALTNSAQVIKATAGNLYGWYIYNPNATAQFVQFYNTAAASVTVGTTAPLFMLTIPATSGANVEFTNGITFSNAGWSWAATSTAGGNGAPSSALDAVAFYK